MCSVESMVIHASLWRDTPVFVTGHTGFKGSWLSLCLSKLGAKVHGYAIEPPTKPNLFEVANVVNALTSHVSANLLDFNVLHQALNTTQPRVVFHLAAQPLVRVGYAEPLETLSTNIMGTAHVLEAIRSVPSVEAVVIVTTDKVYENKEWVYPYREIDPLGGHDPYSASKAATELIVASYRSSFFNATIGDSPKVATARAGNVIGGGDWAKDRLIPDCLRSFEKGEVVKIRYPDSIRPWQHVLESLSGYLLLAEKLLGPDANRYTCAWNFGPPSDEQAAVKDVAEKIADCWGCSEQVEILASNSNPHESGLLQLDSTRARVNLDWRMRWPLECAIEATVAWHQAWLRGEDMYTFTLKQIETYQTQD